MFNEFGCKSCTWLARTSNNILHLKLYSFRGKMCVELLPFIYLESLFRSPFFASSGVKKRRWRFPRKYSRRKVTVPRAGVILCSYSRVIFKDIQGGHGTDGCALIKRWFLGKTVPGGFIKRKEFHCNTYVKYIQRTRYTYI